MKPAALFLLVLTVVLAVTGSGADVLPRIVPGQVIVRMKPLAGSAARGLGYRALAVAEDAPYEIVAPRPGQSVEEAVADLAARGDVEFAQPNYIYRGLVTTPNDTFYPSQYHLPLIKAHLAWDIGRGGATDTLAILDSGADTSHIDLGARIVFAPGIDTFDGDSIPADTAPASGHGTATAGIAAAITNNASQVAGVDWLSNLLLVRVLQGAGATGSSVNIEQGIRKAIDHKAKVISMSLGFDDAAIDPLIENALIIAENAGIIVVAAAGNSGGSPVIYPASSTRAIAVGASTSTDERSSFSTFGAASGMTGVDVVAPGSGITTLALNSGTTTLSGTSFSTPIVAAAGTLVSSLRPGITPAQFLGFLRSTAKDIGDPGWDEKTGAGRIDLQRLLAVATARLAYGDSLPTADTRTAPVIAAVGRQNRAGVLVTGTDSYIGYFQRHDSPAGTIQFYFQPDSVPTGGDTRFILTQKGNRTPSAGNIDLILRTDGKIEYRMQGLGKVISKTALVAGQWYHIALNYGIEGMGLYINGDSEIGNGLVGFPPFTDTIFLGAPFVYDSALTATGRFEGLAFGDSQLFHFPAALFARIESHIAEKNEAITALLGWKAYETETNAVLLDVYADQDSVGFDGTLLASGLANDQNESVPLSGLTIGNRYWFYIVATDQAYLEKAYAYAPAAFLVQAPAVVFAGGSAGSPDNSACLLGRVPLLSSPIRQMRELLLTTNFGRILTWLYYAFAGGQHGAMPPG